MEFHWFTHNQKTTQIDQEMRHPTEILCIATHYNAPLSLLQHRHCWRYLTLCLLQCHLQPNLNPPGPWHVRNGTPEMIQAVEVRRACNAFFKQLCLEHSIQAKCSQILP